MTAVVSTHPTISRFAIADGMLHIGARDIRLPRAEIGNLVAGPSGQCLRDDGQSHSVRSSSRSSAIRHRRSCGADRQARGLHAR